MAMSDLLPVLGLGSPGAVLAEAFGGRGLYERGFLHQWSEAKQPDQPAIIFVPGFLSEDDPQQDGWRRQIVKVARRQQLASFVLHWPSGTEARLFAAGSPLRLLTAQVDALSGTGAGALLGAALVGGLSGPAAAGALATLLAGPAGVVAPTGAGVGLVTAALRAWREAVDFADKVGSAPENWTRRLNRPVILAGHSLGGRIVLRAAESGRVDSLESVIALAPAIRSEDLVLERTVENTRRPPEVYWSRADAVLEFLFRIGEGTWDHSLGFSGPSKRSGLSSFDTSVYDDAVTAHGTYGQIAAKLLKKSPTFRAGEVGTRVRRKFGNKRPKGVRRTSCCPKAGDGTRSVWRCGCGYRWCGECLPKQNVAVGDTAIGRLLFSDYTCRYCNRTISAKHRVVTVLAGMTFGEG